MAGCCLYNDPIFPDWRGAICFVCHTKRREAVWVQADHPTTHTHTNTNTRRTLLSWRPPIDFLCQQTLWLTGGQALAFVSLGQKQQHQWRIPLKRGTLRVKLCRMEQRGVKALRRIFDFNTWNLFFNFPLNPAALFFCALFVINTLKDTIKTLYYYVPPLVSQLQSGIIWRT